jgi:hypothetical protein
MQADPLAQRGNHSWQVIGRLKPGVTVEQVRKDLGAVAAGLETQYPASNLGWGVDAQTIREQQTGNFRPVLMIMMASVAFVLLIACANVANLLLARATARAKEMAVRVALGADRWRIVRQLLVESVMVALIGAALGIAFAYAFLQWIKANILGGIPFWMQFTIDAPVLAFTTAVAVATGLLFGLVPAIQSARPNLNETLRDGGSRGTSAGRARQRLRSSLVVGEVALSLVLLVGAALLIRSFLGMQTSSRASTRAIWTMRVTLSVRVRFTYKDTLLVAFSAAQRPTGHHLGVDHEQHSARRRQQQQLLRRRGSAGSVGVGAAVGDSLGVAQVFGDAAHPAAPRPHVHAAGMGRQRCHRPSGGDQRIHGAEVLEDRGRSARQAIQVWQRDRHVAPLDHDHRRRGGHQASGADGGSRSAGLHAVSPGRLEHGGDRGAHAQ